MTAIKRIGEPIQASGQFRQNKTLVIPHFVPKRRFIDLGSLSSWFYLCRTSQASKENRIRDRSIVKSASILLAPTGFGLGALRTV